MPTSILIVDDELAVASVVGSALRDEGYGVVVAWNGTDGLRRFNAERPDLLICDVMMPFLDGAAMCKEIRSNEANADVRILVMSVVEEDVLKAQFTDYDAFLRKPFRKGQLLARVNTLLGRPEVLRSKVEQQ
jgi:DNA-binding response OmpR family regulator